MKQPLPKRKQHFRGRRRIVESWHRFYDPETGRYISADPIGLTGGMNLYAYVGGNPINYKDPTGLKTCYQFVDALIDDRKANCDKNDLGKQFLNKRGTTLNLPKGHGFKPELVAGGQNGAVSRHIYGHAGAILAYGGIVGGAASAANETIDWLQGFQPGRSKAESDAEVADDWAARKVASLLENVDCCLNQSDEKYLRTQLRRTLCTKWW